MLKRVFTSGKMNQDADERLLPEGEYRYALNLQSANSEGSDVGSLENSKGNVKLTSFELTNAITIGSYEDGSNQKIYWFVTSDEKDLVAEYDYATSTTSIVLQDDSGLLNFSTDFLITGVVKIFNEDFKKDLLIWTDNLNPIRSINIERAKTYGINGFNDEQISLAKSPPMFSPTYEFTNDSRSSENSLEDKFLAFAYRYVYKDGYISALSPFSYCAFSPSNLDIDFYTLENKGMSNAFNALDITFNTGSSEVEQIDLVFKESNSNTPYQVESFLKSELSINDNDEYEYRFINDKVYAALPDDELFRLYDNVPNKAKALDLVGSRLVFGNYEEGFDIIDSSGNNIEIDYSVEIKSTEVDGSEVPTSGSGLNVLRIDLSGFKVTKDNRLSFAITLNEYDSSGEKSIRLIIFR